MRKSLANFTHRNPLPVEPNRRIITNPDGTITLSIPISFKRHGGRKYIIAPTVESNDTPHKNAIAKALGRAFHWQAELENDPTLTQEKIAKREGFGSGYVSKLMNLTLLAPDVIEAILDGSFPKYITLAEIYEVGYLWDDQRRLFEIAA